MELHNFMFINYTSTKKVIITLMSSSYIALTAYKKRMILLIKNNVTLHLDDFNAK